MSGTQEELSKGVAYALLAPGDARLGKGIAFALLAGGDIRLSKGVAYLLVTDTTPLLLHRARPPSLIDDELYSGPLLTRRRYFPLPLPVPQSSDAGIVYLDWSDNRGKSYGNPVGQSLGAIGEYRTILQWQRLGMARDRVFRLTWSSNSFTSLQGAEIDATVASS